MIPFPGQNKSVYQEKHADRAYNKHKWRAYHSVYIQLKEMWYPSSDQSCETGTLVSKKRQPAPKSWIPDRRSLYYLSMRKGTEFSHEYHLDCGRRSTSSGTRQSLFAA